MRNVQTSIAGALALTGFAVGVVSAFAGGADAAECLSHGLIAIPVCYLVGMLISSGASVAIEAHVQAVTAGNPLPDIDQAIEEIDPEGTLRDVT